VRIKPLSGLHSTAAAYEPAVATAASAMLMQDAWDNSNPDKSLQSATEPSMRIRPTHPQRVQTLSNNEWRTLLLLLQRLLMHACGVLES
jgi:hypothetical protein